jgi:hypothetical protein
LSWGDRILLALRQDGGSAHTHCESQYCPSTNARQDISSHALPAEFRERPLFEIELDGACPDQRATGCGDGDGVAGLSLGRSEEASRTAPAKAGPQAQTEPAEQQQQQHPWPCRQPCAEALCACQRKQQAEEQGEPRAPRPRGAVQHGCTFGCLHREGDGKSSATGRYG